MILLHTRSLHPASLLETTYVHALGRISRISMLQINQIILTQLSLQLQLSTLFGTDIGDGGNKTTDDSTDAIVSIHLAEYSNKCSKHNDDGSVKSFESTVNDGRTSDNDVSITYAPNVAGELENDNIDDDVITDDKDDNGNNDDNNDPEDMSNDDNDYDSSWEDSVSPDDNTNFTTNLPDIPPAWMSLVAMADDVHDDDNDDPDDYNNFWSEYDLNGDGIFDNNDIEIGEGFVCMTLTNNWLPSKEQYDIDNIMICPGVFYVGNKLSIYPNLFNETIKDSCGCTHSNENPISNTQMFHPAILKASKRIKNGVKSDDISNDGTTVQLSLNTWVPHEVSNSINNNNNNNNIFNRNNNNKK